MKKKSIFIFGKGYPDELNPEEIRERELEEILNGECEKEAERIEEYAMRNAISMSEEEQERMHLAILKRVQQEQEQKRLIEREREKRDAKRRTAGVRKAAVAAACVLVILFGTSMTSEGNHLYLKSFWSTEVGDDDTHRITSNGEDRMEGDVWNEEREAREKIEAAFLVRLPEFFYLPEGFCYSGYKLDEVLHIARIQYECNGGNMWLEVSDSQMISSEGSVADGRYLETLQMDMADGSVAIELYAAVNKTDGSEVYRANWEYKNVQFELDGKIKKEEFYKILKKIRF